jgi:hypothetical protein
MSKLATPKFGFLSPSLPQWGYSGGVWESCGQALETGFEKVSDTSRAAVEPFISLFTFGNRVIPT